MRMLVAAVVLLGRVVILAALVAWVVAAVATGMTRPLLRAQLTRVVAAVPRAPTRWGPLVAREVLALW